ncbi:MAG: restriction endonuclease [Steroidobacteraceae bacterium]
MSATGVGDQRKSEFELLLSLPWWVGLLVGAASYLLVGWLLPLLLSNEATHAELSATMQVPALLLLSICLTLAGACAYRALHMRRKFAARNGLETVRHLGQREFRAKVADAFKRRGYDILQQRVTGADLVLSKDGRRYFVRCKYWKLFNVGLERLTEFHMRMTEEAASGGFFISSGVFTRHARQFAAEVNIELVGGISLLGFLETDQVPTAPTPYREPVFLSNTALTIPVCPHCGSPMVRRVAKYGKTAGEEFWGCGQFPHCRGTR